MVNRGLVLILVLGVVAVIIIGASAVGSLTSSEMQMVKRQNSSIRAFYLAEAGIEDAIYRLKEGEDADFKSSLYIVGGEYEYDVDITGVSPDYAVVSSGAYPDINASDKVTRKVKVDVTVAPNGDPNNVTNAVEVNGTLKVSGAASINGGIEENANPDFQYIFGITKEEMEAMAHNKYLDPPNNQMPVDRITWVNLSSDSNFRISQTGWSGGGILVVKEPSGSESAALQIEGGEFNGVIWIIGNLRISGNAVINGAIFVENGSAEVTQMTGTPTITYDPSKIAEAFKYLGNSINNIANWQEIQ